MTRHAIHGDGYYISWRRQYMARSMSSWVIRAFRVSNFISLVASESFLLIMGPIEVDIYSV